MVLNQSKIDNLSNLIAQGYDITKEELFSSSRVAHIAEARQVFCYCLRQKFQLSFPAIGAILNRDHTTVMHACNKISQDVLVNKIMQDLIEQCFGLESKVFTSIDLEPAPITNNKEINDTDIISYVKDKHKKEIIEYEKSLSELKEQKEESINKINQDYKTRLERLKENKLNQENDYQEVINNLKQGKYLLAENYLSPKNNLMGKYNLENKIKIFLPKYDEDAELLNFPIKFNNEYINSILNILNERDRDVIINRYGFFDNEFQTLDKLSENIGVSRERVRQILLSCLNRIYYHNSGGARQVIEIFANKVIDNNLILLDEIVDVFFEYNVEDKKELMKFFLVLTSIVKWIKKFEFNGFIYLINYENENFIFDSIDKIKKIIEKLYENMPDLVEDKWLYIYNNLKMYEFFQDHPSFLEDKFIRSCYDNYLFESELVIRKNNDLSKYKIDDNKQVNKITKGVPNEYEIFFK